MKLLRQIFRKRKTSRIVRQQIEIVSDRPDSIKVWFEPWGHGHDLLPNTTLSVIAESQNAGSLEVVKEENLLAVYGWNGCAIKAFQDEALVVELFELPDLGVVSPREVVESLFGGPGGPYIDPHTDDIA